MAEDNNQEEPKKKSNKINFNDCWRYCLTWRRV